MFEDIELFLVVPETAFGSYGLPVLAIVLGLCVIEFIIILVLMARVSKHKQRRHEPEDEKSVPKLKMLEVRKSADIIHRSMAPLRGVTSVVCAACFFVCTPALAGKTQNILNSRITQIERYFFF